MLYLDDHNVRWYGLPGLHSHQVSHDDLGPEHGLEGLRLAVEHLSGGRVRHLVSFVSRRVLQNLKQTSHKQHYHERDEDGGVAIGVTDGDDALHASNGQKVAVGDFLLWVELLQQKLSRKCVPLILGCPNRVVTERIVLCCANVDESLRLGVNVGLR